LVVDGLHPGFHLQTQFLDLLQFLEFDVQNHPASLLHGVLLTMPAFSFQSGGFSV
jgi:hypothetical protein